MEPRSNKVTLSYGYNGAFKKKGKIDDRNYKKLTVKEYELMRKQRVYDKGESKNNQNELDPTSNEFLIDTFTNDSIHSVANGMNVASSFRNSRANINLKKVAQRFDGSSPRQGSPRLGSPNLGINTIRYSNNISNRNEIGTFRYEAGERQITDNDRQDTLVSEQ